MRRTRRIFLLAILLILGAVASVYIRQKALEVRSRPTPPPPLKTDISATSTDWVWYKNEGGRPMVEARAREMERTEQPAPRLLLKGVKLKLYHKDGTTYDFVRCERAEFDEPNARMYSDGAVEITLAMPEGEEKQGRLLKIESSGVIVEANSGKARTDRLTKFAYDLGDGYATGANYDPSTRQLELFSDIVLNWRGTKPGQKAMRVEAGHLVYDERQSKVFLSPWSKLSRDNLRLEAADTVVTIEDGDIRVVESNKAKGNDKYPNRELAFGADHLQMNLSEKSQMERIVGTGNSSLQAVSVTARTNVASEVVEMAFEVSGKERLLKTVNASGKVVVESKPVARAGAQPQATRVLKAESVLAKMRAGGEEMEAMETHSPGTLDLLANAPNQPSRHMAADRIWITYAEGNQIEGFRAVKVATETRKPKGKAKTEPPPALTTSNDLLARFNAKTGDMSELEQWGNFKYKEGDREATSDHALLDSSKNLITLSKPARAWDATGSVNADRIVMNQQTGDFTAEGNVASTRMPDKKTAAPNAMLSQDEPIHALAGRMVSTERNQRVLYEGKAVLWQSANRLEAERVMINRKDQTLAAEDKVVSQFLDKKADPKTKRQPRTLVRASTLHYSDKERVAVYQGPVRLIREEMDVKAKDLKAWLNESKKDSNESTLNHAFADGDVEIFQTQPDRTRRGQAEHAEFYVAEDKVILNGGIAQMVDSLKGTTRGKQLTYYSRNDTLQVEGAITQPAVSKIRRN